MAVRRRRPAAVVLAAIAAMLVPLWTSCSSGAGEQLNYAVDGTLTTYNVNTVAGAASAGPQAFARSLTGFFFHGPDGQAVADLDFGSVSVVGRDPLVLDYQISDKAVYSDGRPVTCDDMVLAWAAQSGRFPGFDAASLAGYLDIENIEFDLHRMVHDTFHTFALLGQVVDDAAERGPVADVAWIELHRNVNPLHARHGVGGGVDVVGVRHRADDRAAVEDAGQARQMLADMDAGDGRRRRAELAADLVRRFGLGIVKLVLGGGAIEVEQDDTLGLAEGGSARRSRGAVLSSGLGLETEEIGQGEGEHAEAAGAEHLTAREAVAGGLGGAENTEHASTLPCGGGPRQEKRPTEKRSPWAEPGGRKGSSK